MITYMKKIEYLIGERESIYVIAGKCAKLCGKALINVEKSQICS